MRLTGLDGIPCRCILIPGVRKTQGSPFCEMDIHVNHSRRTQWLHKGRGGRSKHCAYTKWKYTPTVGHCHDLFSNLDITLPSGPVIIKKVEHHSCEDGHHAGDGIRFMRK